MKFLFSKIFTQSKAVPERIQKELLISFPDAINIDWEIKDKSYEAIFYLNDVENIATISAEGNLVEHKKNLWPGELPTGVFSQSAGLGEIMNAIAIHKGNSLFYEVIIRDSKFQRTLLIFSGNGILSEKRKI